jgi:hypothetical protein
MFERRRRRPDTGHRKELPTTEPADAKPALASGHTGPDAPPPVHVYRRNGGASERMRRSGPRTGGSASDRRLGVRADLSGCAAYCEPDAGTAG